MYLVWAKRRQILFVIDESSCNTNGDNNYNYNNNIDSLFVVVMWLVLVQWYLNEQQLFVVIVNELQLRYTRYIFLPLSLTVCLSLAELLVLLWDNKIVTAASSSYSTSTVTVNCHYNYVSW